jgi:hypothetical protein
MRTTIAIAILGFYLAVPGSAIAQDESSFSFTSEPGDYIGQGQSVFFTPNTASFNASTSQNNNQISGSVFPFAGGFWQFRFEAPIGQVLEPGVYEQATRFQTGTTPGLDISGDGRGCNMLTGRFEVLEAVYGPLGYVERFHATFEQHCEGAAPALFGEVQIVNPPPPPALTIQLTLNRKGSADGFGSVRLTGTATCSMQTTLNVSGVLQQRLNRFALASGTFSGPVTCLTTPTQWSIQVVPSGDVPFGPGMANANVTANGFDPNYGSFVTVDLKAAVQLSRSSK